MKYQKEVTMDSRIIRSALTVVAVAVAATGWTTLAHARAAATVTAPRVDLKVLVISDGTAPVSAIAQELTAEGVPITVVNLNSASRPVITASFLGGNSGGQVIGYYDGVVTPGDVSPSAVAPLTSAEQVALASYETSLSVRQVDAYMFPNASVGLQPPSYGGPLDGTRVTVTPAAKSAGFGYLKGSFNFEGTKTTAYSYGYLTNPLPNTATTSFTTFLTDTSPDGTQTGTLAGVYDNSGQQQLVIGFGYNYYQLQFSYLGHGIVEWLTKGVNFGHWRNYLSMQVGDVFGAATPWTVSPCTPAVTCVPGESTSPIRMVPGDVNFATSWERRHRFSFSLVFNGGEDAQFAAGHPDRLLTRFQADPSAFRWVNGTYTNEFLGCVQNFTVSPWQCQTSGGNTLYVSPATISSQIRGNDGWAAKKGIPVRTTELATFADSGPAIPPQQPSDNPGFDSALGPDGVRYVDLNGALNPAARLVGSAVGVPVYALDIFNDVSTPQEETAEYNWIYVSAANGGGGLCGTTTACISPLDLSTGWQSYILPLQARIILGITLENNPEPFYVSQGDLAGGRLTYSVLDSAFSNYHAVYADNAPIVNPSLTLAGQVLLAQNQWAAAEGNVTGYVQGRTVTVTGAAGTAAPLTAPCGTRIGSQHGKWFGKRYGTDCSGSLTLRSGKTTLTLTSSPFPAVSAAVARIAPADGRGATTRAIRQVANPARLPAGRLGVAIMNATIGAKGGE